jgi:RNA polymerase sigma-70 factor (ECF subfamily)
MTVWDAVNKLDRKYREVVVLYYYQGLKIPDIAEALEISRDNVKQRLSRARKELKSDLEGYYG